MSSTMPQIYIDIDDVLCDTAVGYLDLIKKEFNKSIAFDEIHSFNLQQSFDLSDEQNRHMFRLGHKPDFIGALEPFSDISPTLKHWQDLGFSIAIVTGRHTDSYQSSLDWLKAHQIPYDSFTMVDKYGWEDTNKEIAISKDDLTRMKFCFAVEDNKEMTQFLRQTMKTPVLLFDRPWNRSLAEEEKILRCQNWQEVGTAAEKIFTLLQEMRRN